MDYSALQPRLSDHKLTELSDYPDMGPNPTLILLYIK